MKKFIYPLSSFASILFVSSLLMISSLSAEEANVIDKKRSLYQNVYIVEQFNLRCMRFRKRNKSALSQSCIDLKKPQKLVFNYYKQVMAATYYLEQPKDILIIGLGGGILAKTFHEIYPNANITSVEIDQVVADMAKKHFGYNDKAKQLTTVVADGRIFVKRAAKKKQQYDFILLDAYNSDYIPEHMMTQEFLQETKSLLKDKGILMANTFSQSKLFDHESATYAAVFGKIKQLTFKQAHTNRLIIASKQTLPSQKQLAEKTNQLQILLRPYDVVAQQLLDGITNKVNWDTKAKILTDQFSPANLLKNK